MKQKFFLFVALLFGIAINAEDIECSCGGFAQGLYDYTVTKRNADEGCCTGLVHEKAYLTTYTYSEVDSWQVDEIYDIEGTTAQRYCCNPA